MKDDDINSIDSLIDYADDGDIPEEEMTEAIPEEYIGEDIVYDGLDDYYDDGNGFVPQKKEKKKKKSKAGGCIGAVVILLIIAAVVLAFISIDGGIIGTYKHNFSNNFTHLFGNFKSEKSVYVNETPKKRTKTRERSEIKASTLISLNNPDNAVFASYKQGIICAASNHMSYIDPSGKVVWETDTAIVEPILAAEGNYILIAEKGRNKLCLYSDRKLVYDVDDPDNVVAAKVSARGDVVAVTDKSSYRGGISVYNKTGEQIYSWASGRDTVISADISSSSRRAAVALLNTDMNAKSVIQFFDLNETKSYSQLEIPNTVIYNLQFTGNTLTAFGDNRLTVLSDSGRVVSDNELTDVQITHSAMDSNGNKLLSLDDGNRPMLNMYAPHGDLKESAELGGVADFIDISGKNILYGIGRDIYFGKINAKSMTKYTATMDIQKLILLSKNTFVIVYSNSLEVITV